MKEVTDRWLKAWRNVLFYSLLVIAGIPTFGFAWVYFEYRVDPWHADKEEGWKFTAVRALESWVHFWRGVMLFIAGFPTLGYTWFLMASLDEPLFSGLRKRYSER